MRLCVCECAIIAEICTLSLHDALPILLRRVLCGICGTTGCSWRGVSETVRILRWVVTGWSIRRSEEHTSELQSRPHLVCRLLLEKKKSLRTRKRRGDSLNRRPTIEQTT